MENTMRRQPLGSAFGFDFVRGFAEGERFSLRRFHNAVLDDGALPLNLLEQRIDEWIARERSQPAKGK